MSIATQFVATPLLAASLGASAGTATAAAVVLHLLGFALGAGAALSLDTIFFAALLDPQGRAQWTHALPRLARVVWAGFAIVVATGVLLVALEPEVLASAKFRAKMLVVLVLGVNAALFHRRVAPRVGDVFFRLGATSLQSAALPQLRRSGFLMGSVSASSWLAAAALGFLPAGQPFGLAELVLGYALLLGAAVGTGATLDAVYRRRLRAFSERVTRGVAKGLLGQLETERTLFGHRIIQDPRTPPRPPEG